MEGTYDTNLALGTLGSADASVMDGSSMEGQPMNDQMLLAIAQMLRRYELDTTRLAAACVAAPRALELVDQLLIASELVGSAAESVEQYLSQRAATHPQGG